ncbi:hypothetical protein [Chryseobacterium luteum]|uniref:Lipoprotein n=1 Tax=Chryseobacterium luteum TaxID=421531 RepID=A0A085ZEE9_9FLAO|nr:hypothetical protein [Chryseobacterium luteum]KFF02813.1 hypothetical protein IX38_12645 [Chryseobacterium luteum]
MKYIKILILSTSYFCALSLQSCNKTPQKTSVKVAKNEIKEVSMSTFGGRSTIRSSTYQITKDSIRYSLLAVDSTQNVHKSYINKNQDWKNLVNKIDLNQFRNLKDGNSHLAYDGNDTEITVVTDHETITKLNAENNKSWDNIVKFLDTTYKK